MLKCVKFGAVAGVVLGGAALAQDPPSEVAPEVVGPASGSGWSLRLNGGGSYEFDADLDGAGDVSVGRVVTGVEFGGPVGEKLRLSFGIEHEGSRYDFGGVGGLLPGIVDGDDLLEEAHTVGLSGRLVYLIDDTWSVIAGGGASWGWEDGADAGDGLTGRGFVSVGHRVSETLSLSYGVGIGSRLEDDVRVIPAIGVDWQIREDVRLSVRGLGGELVVGVEDDLDVKLFVAGALRSYRLADDHAALPDGVFNDTSVTVGVGVDWRPLRGLEVGVGVGAVVYRELELLDSSGDDLDTIETDPSLSVGVRVDYAF